MQTQELEQKLSKPGSPEFYETRIRNFQERLKKTIEIADPYDIHEGIPIQKLIHLLEKSIFSDLEGLKELKEIDKTREIEVVKAIKNDKVPIDDWLKSLNQISEDYIPFSKNLMGEDEISNRIGMVRAHEDYSTMGEDFIKLRLEQFSQIVKTFPAISAELDRKGTDIKDVGHGLFQLFLTKKRIYDELVQAGMLDEANRIIAKVEDELKGVNKQPINA